MNEVGAFSEPVEDLVNDISNGIIWDKALKRNKEKYSKIIHQDTYTYVNTSINMSLYGDAHQIAAFMCFSREFPTPDYFTTMVNALNESKTHAPIFKAFIDRHIELDSEEHTPMS